MRTFKIHELNNYKTVTLTYITADSHADALKQVSGELNTKRIYNSRFREIELTHHYFLVEENVKHGKSLVFEVI